MNTFMNSGTFREIEFYLVKLQSLFIWLHLVKPVNCEVDGCSNPFDKIFERLTGTKVSYSWICQLHDQFYIDGQCEKDRIFADKCLRMELNDYKFPLGYLYGVFVRAFGGLFFNYQK